MAMGQRKRSIELSEFITRADIISGNDAALKQQDLKTEGYITTRKTRSKSHRIDFSNLSTQSQACSPLPSNYHQYQLQVIVDNKSGNSTNVARSGPKTTPLLAPTNLEQITKLCDGGQITWRFTVSDATQLDGLYEVPQDRLPWVEYEMLRKTPLPSAVFVEVASYWRLGKSNQAGWWETARTARFQNLCKTILMRLPTHLEADVEYAATISQGSIDQVNSMPLKVDFIDSSG
ncbi:hypothetical protein C8J56DRAFT_136254 [Mycena floridula]|nr:hypothetical protein C8J56DRAFT_136254 [Mycena floridula]